MISVKFMLGEYEDPDEFIRHVHYMPWLNYLLDHSVKRDDIYPNEEQPLGEGFKLIEYQFHLTDKNETYYRLKYERGD